MSIHLILLLAFFAVGGVVAILIAMGKCGFFRCLLFSVLSGVGALFALHFTSLLTGLAVPVTWYSIGVSAFGGIPSVLAMLVIKLIW